MIVVDASALIDFLLGRPQAEEAFGRALSGREEELLHAPELIELETLNALRRLSLAGAVSDELTAAAASALGDAPIIRHSHMALRERIWTLRHELTAYDASYLALAEALPDPVLITADAGLAARAERSVGVIHCA